MLKNVGDLKTIIESRIFESHRDLRKNLYDQEDRTKKLMLA